MTDHKRPANQESPDQQITTDKYRTMLERVANELGDPMGERWCDNEQADRELLRALLTDVLAVLEGDEDYLQDNQRETDYEPVYATLHFYYNDPDSMRRFRLCNRAEEMKLVLWELDQWFRNKIKYNDADIQERQVSEEGLALLQTARDQLRMRCEDYGIDLDED